MRCAAVVAALGLVFACTAEPEKNDNRARVEQVQPASFNAPHGVEFKVVADGSTFMQTLFEHVAPTRTGKSTDADAITQGISAEIDRC